MPDDFWHWSRHGYGGEGLDVLQAVAAAVWDERTASGHALDRCEAYSTRNPNLQCSRTPGHPGRHITTGAGRRPVLEGWPGHHRPCADDLIGDSTNG